jgi:tetratricopeptide (TPR) repeat protein
MSLINQMLKDLEERGGLNKETVFKPAQDSNEVNQSIDDHEDDIQINQKTNKQGAYQLSEHKFVVISSVLILIYLGIYFWVKNPQLHGSHQPNNPLVNHQESLLTSQAPAQSADSHDIKHNSDAIVAEITKEIAAQIKAQDGEVDEFHVAKMVEEAKNSQPETQDTLVKHQAAPAEKAAETSLFDEINEPAYPEAHASHGIKNADVKQAEMITKKAEPKKAVPQNKTADIKVAEVKLDDIKTPSANVSKKAQSPIKEAKIAKNATNPTLSEAVKSEIVKPEDEKTELSTTNELVIAKTKSKKAVPSSDRPSSKVESIARAPVQNTNTKANFSKTERPEQKSENLYQTALNYVQQGRVSEAQTILKDSLSSFPRNHDARQTLAALLLDNNRMTEAKDVLNDGLKVSPDHVGFRKAVARLEVELGEQSNALTTLLQGSSFAMHDAPYQAFLGTMLQRQNRHAEAIEHFNAAIAIDRTLPNVFVGLGISLQATNRFEDAQMAYQHAKGNASLDQNLESFIDLRIKEMNQRISAK